MATSVEAVQDKSPALDLEANAVSLTDSTSDRLPPTAEEKQKLRKLAGCIPWASYLLCIVELAERASFYGCKTVFNNFLQFPLPKGGNGAGAVAKNDPNGYAGALNRGLQFASAMVLLFNFLAYVIPIFGAWLGDTKTGRFRAIMYGVIIGGVAHGIMVGGAAPAPNVVPLIIDQYTDQTKYVKTLKSGERVIVDPETTIQRIMLIFYMCINVGAFFMIATTYIENAAHVAVQKPQGTDLDNFFKIVWLAIKENKGRLWAKNFFDSVKPSVLAAKGKAASCVSPVSIWWQLPTVMLGAIGELFTTVTAYEMAYARAPEGMESTVVAINLAMQALSSALAQILIPSIKDPNLIWVWAAPGIALFVRTIIFWVRHHHVNDEKFLIRESFEEGEFSVAEKK
ncbi:peptide transport [Fusarium coicis]|nr:peptide transport [Fusarium coicis]